jgi:HK97 family phage portal protein
MRMWPFNKKDINERRNSSEDEKCKVFSAPPAPIFRNTGAMHLSAVYRCVEVISDSVAQLPLEPYYVSATDMYKNVDHPTYALLNREPNRRMTRFTFLKLIVSQMLLAGNAYALIRRDRNGTPLELVYVPSESVMILEPSATDIFSDIKYSIAGINRVVEHTEILHFLNFTYDGIRGVSTVRHAANTLNLANAAGAAAAGLFESGGMVSGILSINSPLTNDQYNALHKAWRERFQTPGVRNGVAILQGNMTYSPVSINPEDQQLLETRIFDVVEICRFFGVSPVKAFDLSKSSYSTVEATQLAFLTDTLAPVLQKIEMEIERKLYLPSEKANIDVRFDTEQLLRADIASQAEYYSKLISHGVVSPNEVRRKLNLGKIEGGDSAYMQINMQRLEDYASNRQVQ